MVQNVSFKRILFSTTSLSQRVVWPMRLSRSLNYGRTLFSSWMKLMSYFTHSNQRFVELMNSRSTILFGWLLFSLRAEKKKQNYGLWSPFSATLLIFFSSTFPSEESKRSTWQGTDGISPCSYWTPCCSMQGICTLPELLNPCCSFLFLFCRGAICDDLLVYQNAEKISNLKVLDVLAALKKEIGKAQFTIQKIPHLVLLDTR